MERRNVSITKIWVDNLQETHHPTGTTAADRLVGPIRRAANRGKSFFNRFLLYLLDEGLLVFNEKSQQWHWDEDLVVYRVISRAARSNSW